MRRAQIWVGNYRRGVIFFSRRDWSFTGPLHFGDVPTPLIRGDDSGYFSTAQEKITPAWCSKPQPYQGWIQDFPRGGGGGRPVMEWCLDAIEWCICNVTPPSQGWAPAPSLTPGYALAHLNYIKAWAPRQSRRLAARRLFVWHHILSPTSLFAVHIICVIVCSSVTHHAFLLVLLWCECHPHCGVPGCARVPPARGHITWPARAGTPARFLQIRWRHESRDKYVIHISKTAFKKNAILKRRITMWALWGSRKSHVVNDPPLLRWGATYWYVAIEVNFFPNFKLLTTHSYLVIFLSMIWCCFY